MGDDPRFIHPSLLARRYWPTVDQRFYDAYLTLPTAMRDDKLVTPLYERDRDSVPGPFYVVKDMCIICSLPVETAPENIKYREKPCESRQGGSVDHCFVSKQPETPAEIDRMIEVVRCSCIAAYRYCGTDTEILQRLIKAGCADQCDALPNARHMPGAMRRNLIKWFALLILLSVTVWVVGLVTGIIIPLFGGVRAERIGQIALGVAAVGEGVVGAMESFELWASRRKSKPSKGFPGPKKYGNKKHVA